MVFLSIQTFDMRDNHRSGLLPERYLNDLSLPALGSFFP